jgi:hypothetical protein
MAELVKPGHANLPLPKWQCSGPSRRYNHPTTGSSRNHIRQSIRSHRDHNLYRRSLDRRSLDRRRSLGHHHNLCHRL